MLKISRTILIAATCIIKDSDTDQSVLYLPNMVLGCAVKMEGSTTKRVLSTIRVTLSEVLMFRFPTVALAPPSLGFS